jgi:hypothetical protein
MGSHFSLSIPSTVIKSKHMFELKESFIMANDMKIKAIILIGVMLLAAWANLAID